MRTIERNHDTALGVQVIARQELHAFSGFVTLVERGGEVRHLEFHHFNASLAADTLYVLLDRAYAKGFQDGLTASRRED